MPPETSQRDRSVDRAAPRNVELSAAESLLRELLLECRDDILGRSPAIVPHLDMFIVGGWVRDHLLGIPCSDVDIALSSMTGVEFSRVLNAFAEKSHAKYQQRARQKGVEYVKPAHFKEVFGDPAMSKKLDTAVGKAFGLDIDLVNLRKELYDDEDSRKPSMTFCTAAEDAFRRDATVNALFVNLETLEVHDFTGQGIPDLERKIMRTPLDPRQTFLDDPLRVLRLIRLASKLNFSVAEEALSCMKQDEIHQALDRKVKRERMSVELIKMMELSHPQTSLQVIFESNLFATVFLSNTSSLALAMHMAMPGVHGQPWPQHWPRTYTMLASILEDGENSGLSMLIASEKEATHTWDGARARLWLMAVYAPIAHCQRQGVPLKTVLNEIKQAVSLTSRTADLLMSCLTNFKSISDTVNQAALSPSPTRSEIGMAIRSWGKGWRLQLLFSLFGALVHETSPSLGELDLIRGKFARFVELIASEGLWEAESARPLLDGREIMTILGVGNGGKYLKTATDELLAFQFDHPESQVEQVKDWVTRQRDRWLSDEIRTMCIPSSDSTQRSPFISILSTATR